MVNKELQDGHDHDVYTEELRSLILRARSGDYSALPDLSKRLDDAQGLRRQIGNLSQHVQSSWIRLLAGDDLFAVECIRHELDRRRSELLTANPSRVEQEIVEKILACWLRGQYAELELARAPVKQRGALQRLLDATERQHLANLKLLTELQKSSKRSLRAKKKAPRKRKVIVLSRGLGEPLNPSRSTQRSTFGSRIKAFAGNSCSN